MTRLGSSLALAVLVAWCVHGVLGAMLAPLAAVLLGAAAGAAAVALTRWLLVGGAVALLAPFGVMLPSLALGSMAGRLGVDVVGFSQLELSVFLVGYTVFLLSAFGILREDLYRLGYAPVPVGIMVVMICFYAALSANWFLATVVVLGQFFWVMKWGSSNWFDHILHVLLLPVAVLALIF